MRALLITAEAWAMHFWFIFRWNTSASFRRYMDETYRADEERRFAEHETGQASK